MDLPAFKYHADPVASGSVKASERKCKCCKQARGYIYCGPVYAEKDLEEAICPWCIADGSAAQKFEAEFFDAEALDDAMSPQAVEEILQRTPGFATWQEGHWPACCGDGARFIMPAGIDELRKYDYTLEGELMGHIVHGMGISGSAATRLLQSLHRDKGPTVYLFQCAQCGRRHFRIDRH